MIRYSLSCADGHRFESWFQSGAAFDRLAQADLVSCTVCGTTAVEKALMAPSVSTAETDVKRAPLSTPADPREAAFAALRQKVEKESDYVGLSFATEARAMHEGRTPERAIWGEANPTEARALVEDGIPVAPLPFRPRRTTN